MGLKEEWKEYNRKCEKRGEEKSSFQEWKKNRAGTPENTIQTDLKPENVKSMFFFKGFGSKIRDNNITAVKNLALKGYSEEQIIKLTRRWFKSQTIQGYYKIAIEEIEDER